MQTLPLIKFTKDTFSLELPNSKIPPKKYFALPQTKSFSRTEEIISYYDLANPNISIINN